MHMLRAGDVDMPALGFGTWRLRGRQAQEMVEAALEIGYRHVDTACIYRNEAEVGAGLRAAGLPREAVFLTTKIWCDSFRQGALQRAADASLKRLGLEQADLFLLHWPVASVPLAESLAALNEVRRRGMARAIGVSNFPSALIEEAQRLSEAPLATDQVEYHPYLSQRTVLQACRRRGMVLTAYSPLAQGGVLGDPVLSEIGRMHGKTAGQVALRWLIQQEGVAAIPRTSSRERAAENLDIFDFALSPAEMARIHALARPDGRTIDELDPAFAWDAG
jgi:diketogulonate reductase-like aldo/keto reductase